VLKLMTGDVGYMAELRMVSVVFSRVVLPDGVTLDTPSGAALAQRVVSALIASFDLFEGDVNKIIVDDKGLLCLAAFGLPPLKHPDDPHRALMSAQVCVDRVARAGAACAVGVTTGRVFCGNVGARSRME
jgi:class 3 adenylate cyclase